MSTADLVRDLFAMSIPRTSKGLVMTLGLYFDKSGPTDEIPAITVAGVISTAEGWTSLAAEWEHALSTFDRTEKGEVVSGLPHFHMTDYDSGRGWYEHWQAHGVKRERFARLLDIIEKHVLGVVCVSVSVEDCEGWSLDPPVEVGFNLAGSHCMNVIPQFRYLVEHPSEQVLYVFEDGDSGFGRLEAVYDPMLKTPWRREYNRIGGKLVTDYKQFPPLQVADILAFEGWKQWAREFGGETLGTRYPYKRLTKSIPGEWKTLRAMLPSESAYLMAQARGIPVTREEARSNPLLAALDRQIGPIPTAPLSEIWG